MHNPMARDMTRKFEEVDVIKHQKRPFFHLSDLQRSKSNDGLPVTSLSSYCFSLPSLLFSGIIYFNPTKTLSISNVLVELTLQVSIHKQKPSVITLVSSTDRCLSIIAPKVLCGGGRRREHNVQCRMEHTLLKFKFIHRHSVMRSLFAN